MARAVNNSRDDHLDTAKQLVFQWFEAIRRRQYGEADLIHTSLKQLGCKIWLDEPQLVPEQHRPTVTKHY